MRIAVSFASGFLTATILHKTWRNKELRKFTGTIQEHLAEAMDSYPSLWGDGDRVWVPSEFKAQAHAHQLGEGCNGDCAPVDMTYDVEGNTMTIRKRETQE